jgi:hypothetical protein
MNIDFSGVMGKTVKGRTVIDGKLVAVEGRVIGVVCHENSTGPTFYVQNIADYRICLLTPATTPVFIVAQDDD